MKDAATALRAWRGEKSLLTASRELECDPTSIWKIEQRQQRPGLALAQRIQDCAGIKMSSWAAVAVKPVRPKRGRKKAA